MMDQFRTMQPVTLGVQRASGEYDYYPSLILDFQEDRSLATGVPMDQGREVMVTPGAAVVVDVITEPGVMRYQTSVLGRTESPLSLTLAWPTGSLRVQRRDHFRVAVSIPVDYKLIEQEQVVRSGRATTMDISTGGIRLRTDRPLIQGGALELHLHLRPGHILECNGRVVRSGSIPGSTDADGCWNGIIFRKDSGVTQKEISRFVMDVQREQMRRGSR